MFKVGDKVRYNNRGKFEDIFIVKEVGNDYVKAGTPGTDLLWAGKYHLDGSGYYAKLGAPNNPPLIRHLTPLEELL